MTNRNVTNGNNEKKNKITTWGLEVKKPSAVNNEESVSNSSLPIPILLRRNRPLEKYKSEGERFAVDLNSRPNEPTKESYAKVPVEEFGAAMLKGMGWKGPEDTSNSLGPIKYIPRPERLGLGASEVQDVSELKKRKPVEQSLGIEMSSEEEKRIHQLNQKKNQKDNKPLEILQKHANVIGIDELAPKRIKLEVSIGSKIIISDGEHLGLKGIVKGECRDGKYWLIELEINSQDVKVHKSHVKRHDPTKKDTITSDNNSNDSNNSNSNDNNNSHFHFWVCSGLKVKIKSKTFLNGRYYNRKGIILDVQPDKTCTIKLLDPVGIEIVHNVPQGTLETCLPRTPDPTRPTVKYLKGKVGDWLFHAACRVLQFDDERGRAIVQLDDDLENVFEAHYDEICEFIQ